MFIKLKYVLQMKMKTDLYKYFFFELFYFPFVI